MGQADPILTKLNAGPAVKKLVEIAIGLASSKDPQQRNHAFNIMESAIKELEDDNIQKKILEDHEKDDDEHKLHEEELKNNNTGGRTTGSDQSSDNTAPYPGTAKDSTNGEKPMQDMEGTENQWNETGGMMPGMMPGGMPQGGGGMPQGGGMPPQQGPGLAPDIAQEMGAQMGPMPPMNGNQMMRQMQYTTQQEIKRIMGPIVKKLELQIRETRVNNGSMKLDVERLRENAPARFRETTGPTNEESFVYAAQKVPGQKRHQVAIARAEIEQMNSMLNDNR